MERLKTGVSCPRGVPDPKKSTPEHKRYHSLNISIKREKEGFGSEGNKERATPRRALPFTYGAHTGQRDGIDEPAPPAFEAGVLLGCAMIPARTYYVYCNAFSQVLRIFKSSVGPRN